MDLDLAGVLLHKLHTCTQEVRGCCHQLLKSGHVHSPDQRWDREPTCLWFRLSVYSDLSLWARLLQRLGEVGRGCCAAPCVCLPQQLGAKGAEGCTAPAPCPLPAQPPAQTGSSDWKPGTKKSQGKCSRLSCSMNLPRASISL